MKKSKKFVLAALALLAITGLLSLAGCKNDSVPPEATSGTETKPVTHTVTFNTDGGSTVASQTVESGQTATRPEPDPTNGDKVLAGWYTSEDDGTTLADTAYNFNTPVEGDITLYAWWLPKPGTVVSDGLTIGEIKLEKTSEVQVLSTAVDLSSLYVVDSEGNSVSKIFVDERVDSIQPFVMGRHEVTQQLYFAVMGKNPSDFKTGAEDEEPKEGLLPVESVSWYDAVVFCNELSELMKLEPVYSKGGTTDTSKWGEVPTSSTNDTWKDAITCDFTKSGYRLPTEVEWEYAARAGDATTNARTWSGTDTETKLEEYAWYSKISGSKTHQVGTKAANSLGLYDMSGNVWEWCWDWYDEKYYSSSSTESGTNPTGPTHGSSGDGRVSRGGSWSNNADNCTVSNRHFYDPNLRGHNLGFRLVRSAN